MVICVISGRMRCTAVLQYDDLLFSPRLDIHRNDLIRIYFNKGYNAYEIMGFLLLCHNIYISIGHLRRVLSRLGLRRNNIESDAKDIVKAIKVIWSQGFMNLGYRSMWRLLNTHFGLRITQKTTLEIMNILDSDGVQLRRRRRLRRRLYANKGPNFLIHIDGNDKLKPFGISIHGAIDGFSRRILWLAAGFTNKNPEHILRLYLNFVSRDMRMPKTIRCDEGTENCLVRDVHQALRSVHRDESTDLPCFLTGRSTANQRIEMFWGILNRACLYFWRNLFNDLRDIGVLDDTDPVHIECLRFCFMPMIQDQLNSFRDLWNVHRIRPQRRRENTVTGIPDVLYFQPRLFGARDHSLPVTFSREEINQCSEQYSQPFPARCCSEEFLQVIELVTQQNRDDLVQPRHVEKALELYSAIIDRLGPINID